MNPLANPIFTDADKARIWLEAQLWPNGPVCAHCGVIGEATLMRGKSHRPGLYWCNACEAPFTVTLGTLYERSHIPLNKWLCATHLMMASKKGMSAVQIGRMLGLSKKTAWFLCHRIREALRQGQLRPLVGIAGGIVEMDETYFGPIEHPHFKTTRGTPFTKGGKAGPAQKRAIIALVERGGQVRSFHVPRADTETVTAIVNENISREARLFTDESRLYTRVGQEIVADHQTVTHSRKEYARGEVHTNSIEGFFSIFKRGMRGNYQHCAERHLHRYLAEFDFRYNHREGLGFSDEQRWSAAILGIVGKRLTYRRINGPA